MGRSQLPTPDSISGNRNIGTQYTDLQPGAHNVSVYTAPTRRDVAEPPADNNISQLGRALTGLNPTLQKLTGYVTEIQTEKDTAAGIEANRQAQAQNIKDLKEATEKGLIPPGASPIFIKAYKQTELHTRALQFQNQLYDAYTNSDVPNSDDPAAFDNFAKEFHTNYRQGALFEGETPKYTPLEIRDSKFDDSLLSTMQALRNQHVQHRVQERTALGKEIATTNANVVLDQFFQPGAEKDFQGAANALKNVFFDPTSGIAANGLTKTDANKLMIDTLALKAIEKNDVSIMDVASSIGTSQNNFLGATSYARAKREAVETTIMTNQIRNDNFLWTKREREALINAGLTPEIMGQIKAAEEKRKTQLWERADRQFEHAMWQSEKAERESQVHITSEAHQSIILTGLTAKDMNNPKVLKSLEWLKQYNPDKWMTMNTYITSFQKEKTTFHDTQASELASAQLRYDMSRNPQGFDSAQIIKKANNGLINPNKVQPLLDDWDKIKTHQEHPFIQDENFQKLLSSARRSTMRDAGDEYGVGAIRAEDAALKMRMYAYQWIQDNPDGKRTAFMNDATKQLESVLQDVAPEFASEQARQKKTKENPKPIPQPDTRSLYEKVAPEAIGGKEKPKPIEQPSTAKAPLSIAQATGLLSPEDRTKLQQLYSDPTIDDDHLDAAIRYFLGPVFKSNGRDAVELSNLKQQMLSIRGGKRK